MKKVTIENVWPRDLIRTDHGVGRVLMVWNENWPTKPAVVEYSWHEKGYRYVYFDWNEKISVLSQ